MSLVTTHVDSADPTKRWHSLRYVKELALFWLLGAFAAYVVTWIVGVPLTAWTVIDAALGAGAVPGIYRFVSAWRRGRRLVRAASAPVPIRLLQDAFPAEDHPVTITLYCACDVVGTRPLWQYRVDEPGELVDLPWAASFPCWMRLCAGRDNQQRDLIPPQIYDWECRHGIFRRRGTVGPSPSV